MDYKAMMMTLQNNEWFTELSLNGKLDKEIVDSIISVFTFNKTLTSFNLKNGGLTRDTWSDIRNIWTANEKLALKSIDFSGNIIDVRIQVEFKFKIPGKSGRSFGQLFHWHGHWTWSSQVERMSVVTCRISPHLDIPGTPSSHTTISEVRPSTWKFKLNSIASCRLDRDASLVLGTMLADPDCVLRSLDMSETSPDFSVFPDGKSLRKLILAGMKLDNRGWINFVEFSKKMPLLKYLDLSRSFPLGTVLSGGKNQVDFKLKILVLTNLTRLTFMDLSDNSLGDLGLKKLILILKEIHHPSLR